MSEAIPILIIGGGVVGQAIAFELSQRFEGRVALIERNNSIRGENQSSRNSGVVHAGIYYPKDKGPLKASLCLEGNKLLYEFCKKHNVPCKQTGKLVVATDKIEEEYLEDVLKTAKENSVPGVKIISGSEVVGFEPNVKATSAIYAPTSGIVDSAALTSTLQRLAEEQGTMYAWGTSVSGIEPALGGFLVKTISNGKEDSFKAELLVNSAGLYSDEVARMVDPESPYVMDPVRGEAAKFYKTRANISMNGLNVYPVPRGYWPNGDRADVSFSEFQKLFAEGKVAKSLGVHLTPAFGAQDSSNAIGETVTVGPAYSKPHSKEDYISARPEEYYLQMARSFFPNLQLEDLGLHQAGIRARLKNYYDFVIETRENCAAIFLAKKNTECFSLESRKDERLINLVGIDSPGLTASLAIAKYVSGLIRN